MDAWQAFKIAQVLAWILGVLTNWTRWLRTIRRLVRKAPAACSRAWSFIGRNSAGDLVPPPRTLQLHGAVMGNSTVMAHLTTASDGNNPMPPGQQVFPHSHWHDEGAETTRIVLENLLIRSRYIAPFASGNGGV